MSAAQNKTISIVVPFFNEEAVIDVFDRALCTVLHTLPAYTFEIICVDDGSTDGTLEKLTALVKRDERYRVLELSRNFGKEAALSAGLDFAAGDAIIPFDADLQDPPELIPRLLEEWEKGVDMVLACRSDRLSDSKIKRITAKMFYRTHNLLSDVALPEDVGDFRLMDRGVVDALKSLPERQRFMKGLFAWVGFKTQKVGYSRASRAEGHSKFSGWNLWNLALEAMTNFSTVPLRIWTYIGCLGAFTTLLYAVFIVLRTLIIGVDVPGYASLLVAVLFLGSLQLISIGLLGEYIGRIYIETKCRPLYLIRKTYRHES